MLLHTSAHWQTISWGWPKVTGSVDATMGNGSNDYWMIDGKFGIPFGQ